MKLCRQCQEAPAATPPALGLCESCLNIWAGMSMVEIEDQAPQASEFERKLTYTLIALGIVVVVSISVWRLFL
jgi:type VI protein secretion system component VasK